MDRPEDVEVVENETPKSEAAPGNGKAKEGVHQITLERVELMTFMFLNERGHRMDAEKRAHQIEFDAFAGEINRKYGITMNEYRIDLSTGVLTLKEE